MFNLSDRFELYGREHDAVFYLNHHFIHRFQQYRDKDPDS